MSDDKHGVTTYPIEVLRGFAIEMFRHFGVPTDEAELAADVLAAADVAGIDTHGVQRLHTYFDMLDLGRINPTPTVKVVRESASTATVDGDNGLGLVVGPKANRIAQEKAKEAGSGWVSVSNTNHFGACLYYLTDTMRDRDLIGWANTNSTKLVAPLWGAERMLGTNPIAIGFPGGHETADTPITVDMATSAAAYGKIEVARRKGTDIPGGWVIDKEGKDSTDPNAMVDGGALLPLGSTREMGGHKGYGLAMAVDLFCAVLSGANWGPFAPPFALRQEIPARSVGKGIGHFFGAWRIDAFVDLAEYRSQIDDYIETFRGTKPQPGAPSGPLIPGDPERETSAHRREHGVPVIASIVDDLKDISEKISVPFD